MIVPTFALTPSKLLDLRALKLAQLITIVGLKKGGKKDGKKELGGKKDDH